MQTPSGGLGELEAGEGICHGKGDAGVRHWVGGAPLMGVSGKRKWWANSIERREVRLGQLGSRDP